MSYIPPPYHFFLLTLAAWRLWKLVADDKVSDKPVDVILRRIKNRSLWRDFLECPYCFGFWVSGFAYAVWLSILGDWPGNVGQVVGVIGVWFALSAAVGLLGSFWVTLTDVQDD